MPSFTFVIQSGPNVGQSFEVSDHPKIIGRGAGSDITIADESLSRGHAKIQATAKGYVIEDLNSTNGTFVNGQRVSGSVLLRSGDTLRLGTAVVITVPSPGADPTQDNQQTLLAGSAAALDNSPTVVPSPPVPLDATYVPAEQVSPGTAPPPPQKSKPAWLWIMGAVIIALLIIIGTLIYLQYMTTPSSPASTAVVQQATETPVPTPTSAPLTNTPEPGATNTPEPIAVPGIAASAAEVKFPPPTSLLIDAFCDAEVEAEATESIYLDWSHSLAPSDADADYRGEWLVAAYYDVTVNGRPVENFSFYQDEDNAIHFWHNLGLLGPGRHFVRVQWYTNRPISNGMDVAPADGQVDEFGPGPAGEGSCEIIVVEPIAATTITPTATPSPTPKPSVTPSPTTKSQVSLPPAPLGIFNNFESQSTWKRGDQPYGEFTRSGSQVHRGSYAGQLRYNFPSPDNDYVVFLQNRRLAGRPNAISAWVYGDGSGHFLNVWLKDANGQSWGMNMGTVDHSGWQEMIAFIDPGQPWPSGHISGPDNNAIDYPITFQALVLDDSSDDYSGQGTIYIDDLNSQEGYTPPLPTPTPASQVQVGGSTGISNQPGTGPAVSGGLMLQVGGQHKYTEPWGASWDGDSCKAHRENSWNDKVRARAFHLQLLLTNNTSVTVPGPWIPTYITANGKAEGFCYFGHDFTSVPSNGTSDITFFTVVDQGDYVREVQLTANGQLLRLCLGPDGSGGACGGTQQTSGQVVVVQPTPVPVSGPYSLSVGKHVYEEWGAPYGDLCDALRSKNFNDKVHMRAFNIELLLTNSSTVPVADNWRPTFITANGQTVQVCDNQYYPGNGPQPGGTNSVTFYTQVTPGDYVRTVQLTVNNIPIQICLDPSGAQSVC